MKTIARVRMLVEVPVGNYPMTATMASIASQAKSEALTLIRGKMIGTGMHLIEDPQVLCVITVEESEK